MRCVPVKQHNPHRHISKNIVCTLFILCVYNTYTVNIRWTAVYFQDIWKEFSYLIELPVPPRAAGVAEACCASFTRSSHYGFRFIGTCVYVF